MHSRREIFAATVTASLAAPGGAAAGYKTQSTPNRAFTDGSGNSSHLSKPRIFARVFCEPAGLLGTVQFYEDLIAASLDQDLDLPAAGIHVVAIGPILILALDPKFDFGHLAVVMRRGKARGSCLRPGVG